MLRVATAAWLGLLALLVSGCSGRPADMPPVYPCVITVVTVPDRSRVPR
jgi:hypothetical protein